MPRLEVSNLIGPRADTLVDALESVLDDELQVVAEYNSDTYQLLYISDDLIEKHGSVDSVTTEADALFNYFHLDFLERELLQDLLWLGSVEAYVTFHDHGIVIRAQTDSAGVYIVADITASVDDVQITIQNTLQDNFDSTPKL